MNRDDQFRPKAGATQDPAALPAPIAAPSADALLPANDLGDPALACHNEDAAYFLREAERCALLACEFAEQRWAKLEPKLLRQRLRVVDGGGP